MSAEPKVKQFSNGMTLLGEPRLGVSSAAMTIFVPCGVSRDPDGMAGAASVASEWALRGAGERNTRQLNDALDALGAQHDESASSYHLSFSSVQVGRVLPEVLDLYADILRRPRWDDETFAPCRNLVLQDLQSLEDEPARMCSILLRERFFPAPLGRNPYGSENTLQAMTPGGLREHLDRAVTPRGAVFAIAGRFDWQDLCDRIEHLFGSWEGEAAQDPELTPASQDVRHIAKDSAQTHIALAHKAVIPSDRRHYAGRVAEAILSQGMGSRLFTEVREKRGLVYHVSSRYVAMPNHAGMFTYAGTRPDLAQQTLEVTVGELQRIGEGIEDEELQRAKTQLRSALVMQGESTSARAGALARDWHLLERPRTLEEISSAVQAVTRRDVMEYLAAFPANDFTALVLGPDPLKTDILN